MAPPPVVPTLDVLEEREPRRGPRVPVAALDQLPLQRGEEALGHGVVVAIW